MIEGNFRFADANSERGRGRGPRGGRGGRGGGRFDGEDRPRYNREREGPPRDREFNGPPPGRSFNGGGERFGQPRITDESSFPALAPKVTAAN